MDSKEYLKQNPFRVALYDINNELIDVKFFPEEKDARIYFEDLCRRIGKRGIAYDTLIDTFNLTSNDYKKRFIIRVRAKKKNR